MLLSLRKLGAVTRAELGDPRPQYFQSLDGVLFFCKSQAWGWSLHLSTYLNFGDTCHVVAHLCGSFSAESLLTLCEVLYDTCSGVLPDSENSTGG